MKFRIRELREKQCLTQTALSKMSNVSRATIWKLETGDNEITTTTTLMKIANALGVELVDNTI